MSHPTSTTHHSSPAHAAGTTHTKGHSHKNTIEQLTEAVNSNQTNNLEKYLDTNVVKTIDSQTVYKDLKEAQEYYTKEHTANKSSQWKIVHFPDHSGDHPVQARISYNNKTYNTTYKFSPSGKIQHIEAQTENNPSPTPSTPH
ncbi:hypothetical protein I4U23_028186 [Adineta vaga]|nr:hypothetical protein I4U23_028186 [Adineta vaga]